MDTVQCAFCGRQMDRDEAIEEGWQPYWWYKGPDGVEHTDDVPACPVCAAEHLYDPGDDKLDGLMLKEGHQRPPVVKGDEPPSTNGHPH